METAGIAKRLAAAACAAAIASFALAGSAFAATVHGADFHGAGSAIESGEVDVLDVDGSAGETVFLTVKQGSEAIAKNLPYTIEADASAADGAEYAGVATLDIDGLDLNALDGTYTIEAYADRAGKTRLYVGAIYGVYADLPDGTTKLIGTRTASKDELTARTFEPAETLYSGGKTYRLAGSAKASNNGVLHFAYEEYDEATTVDGVVKYVDATGATVATTKIPGLKYGESRTVDIPTAVTADDGSLYRTVFFQKSVTAANPGATSFSIYCVQMSEASQALAGFYIATINMVDGDGNVIASDSVNVTGEFVYTAPSTIYKTEVVDGEARVVTYRIDGSPTIRLSAANDGVLNRARTIEVAYTADALSDKEVEVTFNLLDGSKRVAEEGRDLGTQTVTATKDEPAVPADQVEADGATYTIVGSAADYAYAVGSGETPVVNVYYLPEGYTPPGAYDVTVNYVNFLTNTVIESHTYASDPDDNSRITISTPASFTADGTTYLRLDGQESDIEHSYYSGIETHTVYYHNENDPLPEGTVINRIRIVYEDGGTTVTTVDGGTTTITVDGGTTTTTVGGDADGTAAASADGATALQLDANRTYNVMDGDGNGTLTNEEGVDSNTERIADNETPLASGFDKGASSSAASSFAQMSQWLLPAGIVVAVAAIAVIAVVMIRRRKDDEFEM